ncbi:MAG: Uncharacterised protein [Flavobacteriia bacterium]|nr:MAG: Uncharacterised protein [Flavobacteriia bacterium]
MADLVGEDPCTSCFFPFPLCHAACTRRSLGRSELICPLLDRPSVAFDVGAGRLSIEGSGAHRPQPLLSLPPPDRRSPRDMAFSRTSLGNRPYSCIVLQLEKEELDLALGPCILLLEYHLDDQIPGCPIRRVLYGQPLSIPAQCRPGLVHTAMAGAAVQEVRKPGRSGNLPAHCAGCSALWDPNTKAIGCMEQQ